MDDVVRDDPDGVKITARVQISRIFMKTVTGKSARNSGNVSHENRSNKARLKRLLKAMLASASPLLRAR